MGQRLVALAREDSELALMAALDSPKHPNIGKDAGELAGLGSIGVPVTSSLKNLQDIEVLIDFSVPEGTMAILPVCVANKIPLVIATTGHSAQQRKEIEAAAHETAILFSANFSLVVNVLFKLVEDTSRMLMGKGFDVEIIEKHHRFKKDAPSGTAMHFAHRAAGDEANPDPARSRGPGGRTPSGRDRRSCDSGRR